MKTHPTIIVAGLGRCGSSLVMQMLHAGGFQVTGEYPAFEDCRIFDSGIWEEGVFKGKAVKVIDPHRWEIDLEGAKVIWLSRNEREQARSLSKFGHLVGGLPRYPRKQLRALEDSLKRDRRDCLVMIHRAVPEKDVLMLTFEALIKDSAMSGRVLAAFVGGDPEAMAAVVKRRGTGCYDGLLEMELLNEKGEVA